MLVSHCFIFRKGASNSNCLNSAKCVNNVNSECCLVSAQCSLVVSRFRATETLNIISAHSTGEVQKKEIWELLIPVGSVQHYPPFHLVHL